MTTKFLQQDLWSVLTASVTAQGGKADVAVAYFGNGANSLLPLAAGSRLVVNASEEAVMAGSTSPAELIKLHLRGVTIYSVPNLHAKLFLVGDRLFVGSSNASLRSAESLVEAMVVTENVEAVLDARGFFDRLVLQPELGKASLERLLQIYVPPQVEGIQYPSRSVQTPPTTVESEHLPSASAPPTSVAVNPIRPTVWLDRVTSAPLPPGSNSVVELGKSISLTKITDPGKHKVAYQWDSTNDVRYKEGDLLFRVLTYKQPCQVEYPVSVLHIRKWVGQDASATFVFIETLKIERSIPEPTVLERLGWSDRPILEAGPIAPEDVDKFFTLWM